MDRWEEYHKEHMRTSWEEYVDDRHLGGLELGEPLEPKLLGVEQETKIYNYVDDALAIACVWLWRGAKTFTTISGCWIGWAITNDSTASQPATAFGYIAAIFLAASASTEIHQWRHNHGYRKGH